MHKIIRPASWAANPIRVDLVGIGGTGSQLVAGLARMHVALRSLGHPYGLQVTLWDPDNVSESNIGRQLFSPGDIGRNKAIVQAHRINHYFGLNWRAMPQRFECRRGLCPDLIITAPDTASARRKIHKEAQSHTSAYSAPLFWLDLGNAQRSGQVMLAKILGPGSKEGGPIMQDLLPEIFDESLPEDDRPSCSLAEALESQDLFVNQMVASWGLHLLWTLIREGETATCGYWINLEEGRAVPAPVPGPKKKGSRRG